MRIGPHNQDVISILVGCLLGDGNSYQSKSKNIGTKIRFRQSVIHKEYIYFLYDFFYTRGYCTDSGPREYKTILINKNKEKKTYYGYEFGLYTFSSLNWLYDLFYLKGVKIISPMLIDYITPMSLAFLIMDDGGWVKGSKSVRIATNNFRVEEVQLLANILKTKYDLNCTIQKLSKKGNTPKDKYSIYIKVESMPKLRKLVVPFIIPSMKYKLGIEELE